MNVTILGAGNMGRALATQFVAGGNTVTLMDRDADKAGALAEELNRRAAGAGTAKATELGSRLEDPVVVAALYYPVAREVVSRYRDQLDGKVLVDISNPLNETFDDLGVPYGTSAAEELAKIAPGARVVKAFNTVFAAVLEQGNVGGQPLDILIAGDDAGAKASVSRLVEEGGQRALDAGPLRRARQLESLGLLMITLQNSLPNPWMTAIKLVG